MTESERRKKKYEEIRRRIELKAQREMVVQVATEMAMGSEDLEFDLFDLEAATKLDRITVSNALRGSGKFKVVSHTSNPTKARKERGSYRSIYRYFPKGFLPLKSIKGAKKAQPRLSREAVIEIYTSDEPGPVIAERLGLPISRVSDVRTGKTWKRITETLTRGIKGRG